MDNKLTIRRRYIESEDREEYVEIPSIACLLILVRLFLATYGMKKSAE